MKYEVFSLEWEYEDQLPKNLTDLEFNLMFHYSEIKDGVRMYPYITLYSFGGSSKRIYIGA